jgi:ParB family chromosome partitioning protein
MFTDLPLQTLPLDQLLPDQQQPRQRFDEAELAALQASMERHGLLQPVLVRFDAVRQQYRIICGERRWRCAKTLGWPTIPCRLIDRALTPAETVALQLTENLQREDLNPLDEARSLARLQELLQCSRDELAAQTQRSPASICRSFKLLDLPADVQTLIEENRLPVSIAAELQRCADLTLLRELAERVAAGQLTRSDVATRVRQATPAPPEKVPRVTMPFAEGITLSVPATLPLADCEAALARALRRLRKAKGTLSDAAAFATTLRTTATHSGGRKGDT